MAIKTFPNPSSQTSTEGVVGFSLVPTVGPQDGRFSSRAHLRCSYLAEKASSVCMNYIHRLGKLDATNQLWRPLIRRLSSRKPTNELPEAARPVLLHDDKP